VHAPEDASIRPARSRRRERDWLCQSWAEVTRLAGELELEPREMQLLELRWLSEARHYDDLWRRQRTRADVLSVVTIIAGLAAPLLVAINAPKWGLAVAGFIVAVAGSLLALFRFGERWRHQRESAMLLKAEGIRFLELRPPYHAYGSHHAAFGYFIDRLEQVNEAQSEEYLALWMLGAPSRDKLTAKAPAHSPTPSSQSTQD
jgi:Protein of unknown function (DUF4231)